MIHLSAQGSDVPPAPGEPTAPTDDAAREAYERARSLEEAGDPADAEVGYAIVEEDYPNTAWADLARQKRAQIMQQQAAEAMSREAYSPGLMVMGLVYRLLMLALWILFLGAIFGFLGYRAGWFWRSAFIARIADRFSGIVTGFQSRKRLAQELELRKANPRDARARHNLGVIYFRNRKYERAVEELGESVSIDPDRIDAQYHYGVSLLRLGRPAEAEAPLEKVVAQKPNHGGDAAVRLAEVKLATGDPTAAVQICNDFVTRNPSDAEGRMMLALALDAAGQPDEVPRLLSEAIQLGRSYRGVRRREALAAARKAKAYLRSRKGA